ncbi:MAG: gliding motility-associated C-terminal domain-containing protein [Bacteroidota bacterium]
MKKLLLGIFIFHCLFSVAQQERSNWFMGTYLGMKFTGAGMQVIPVNTTPSYAPYGSACYSDPLTGQLLFYTNGSYVYNRQHKQMPNGFYINEETYGIHTVIVPHPGNKFLYYIISSASYQTKLYYATVDMRLQGGQGDVVEKIKVLDGASDLPFCVVKQLYDEGYWIITHAAGTNEFKCFRLGKNGLQTVPVVSYAGTASPAGARYTYGKMVSNSKGDRFVFTHGWTGVTAIAEEFSFDKACGKVTFQQSFYAHPVQAEERFAYPAYSSDDSKLYISWIYSSGQTFLLQYNLKDASPTSSYFRLSQGNEYDGDLQLAPDGKIYVATAENAAVTAKVNVIENPNQLGVGCNYKQKQVVLANNSNVYFTEHFPQFIMDVSSQLQGQEKPVLVFQNTCEGQPVTISLKAPLQADSLLLDLGDGTVLKQTSVTHQYAAVGNYAITFKWWMCGYEYNLTDTLKLRNTPKVLLGKDSTVCFGDILQLAGPAGLDEYRWSTGDSSVSLTVTKPGKYLLKVRDGNCWGEDETEVGYYPQLWTALGDEYVICDDDKELVKLDAGENFIQYKWMPTGDTTQWIIVGDVGDYFVVVKDFRGCNGNDGTRVKRRCPVSVHFPNIFTPNNDGVNDAYVPKGKDVVSYHMKIYNRWGQLVFETTDITKTWNGVVKGEAANADVYVYTATYSGYFNKRLKEFTAKGSFTLLR